MLALTKTQKNTFSGLLYMYCLEEIYAWFIQHNQSNNLPFHNLYHTQCMMLNCFAGALMAEFESQDVKTLLLAAMFHDANHSGGLESDAVNIERALALLDEAALVFDLKTATVSQAKEIIQATQYPYVKEATTEAEHIIRDADMMQILEACWFEHIFIGLRREFSHRMGAMTLAQFCDFEESFFASVPFHSLWGKAQEPRYRATAAARVAVARAADVLGESLKMENLQAYEALTGSSV